MGKRAVSVFIAATLTACGGPVAPNGAVAGGAPVKATAWTNFSGERALADVRALVQFGPRPAGSAELEASRQFIETKLKEAGWETQRQAFADDAGPLKGSIQFVNLRARWPSGTETWARRVTTLLCSHYDTKWFQRSKFVGANDGGSSTGLLLESARAAAAVPEFAMKLELVFFDGEEAVGEFTPPGGFNDTRYDGLYGSRYYAKQWRNVPAGQRPKYGVLFDMIGDAELQVTFPENGSARLAAKAISAAAEHGWQRHFSQTGYIVDDHVPLSWLGMEVIDFIDFESYRPFWHTPMDTLDKLSAASIEKCGRTGLLFAEKYLAD